MKNQKGSAAVVTLICVLGSIAALIGVCVMAYVSNYNYGNKAEKQILAEWENNENILAGYSLKITEMAQVNTMYKDDVKEVFTSVMTGRYGENGSQAMWQWLKEQNPQIDPSLYTRLQQVMEAGRNEFKVSQTRFVDIKRTYETNLGYLWKGFWLRTAGYPKINLADYKIITSGHAKKAFETGIDEGIKLR